MSLLEFDGQARMWPNDCAPWDVLLPVSPTHGAPTRLELAMNIGGYQFYKVTFKRKDRSDGCWNFYETSRKRLAPAY